MSALIATVVGFFSVAVVGLFTLFKKAQGDSIKFRNERDEEILKSQKLQVEHDLEKLSLQELVDRSNTRLAGDGGAKTDSPK